MLEQYRYEIWLSAIEGIGAHRFNNLCDYFGSAKDVYENAKNAAIANAKVRGMSDKLYTSLLEARNDGRLESNLEQLYANDVAVYIHGTDCYPPILNTIPDAPPVLYAKGCMDLADMDRSIGVVGTRRCTRYGRKAAEELCEGLAAEAVCVVSGMARGIDTHAHIGALNGGGFTVAVLGCGVDVVYPPENKRLYEQIMASGAIVSEFFPGMQPCAANFPARNRIISALSKGILVVESAEKGGALITVEFALEQGKDVFAVPGNIDSPASIGCNRLIRNGAVPTTCVADILSEYNWDVKYNPKKAEQQGMELTFEESHIVEILMEGELQYDILADMTGMDGPSLATCLTIMELRGIIKQLPGRVYTMEK